MSMDSERALENRRMLRRLAIAAVGMFGFGFALVPFYKTICEIAGINRLGSADEVANTQVDAARTLTVEFDANTHGMPWRFKPLKTSIAMHPGELVRVDYEVENTLDRPVTGQAIPSYGPQIAGLHFKKLDCFCFTQQTLAPREKRVMPVLFTIDRALPDEVNTVTLSYTFFEVAGTAAVPPPPGGNG
ncbi:MAG: cytochrome c oxidase assembly protein [Rhodocyclaceae bacterium]